MVTCWNSTFEMERGERILTSGAARIEPFACIAVVCNRKRRHPAIGEVSPAELGTQHRLRKAKSSA